MTNDSSQSPSDRAAALQRKKFIGKLIVLGCIIAFSLLKPKVEAWWNARNAPEIVANEPAKPELSNEAIESAEQAPGGLVTSDPATAAKPSGGTKSKIDTSFLDTLEPGKSKTRPESLATAKPASKSSSPSTTSTSPKSSPKTTASTKSNTTRPKLATPPPFPDKSKPTATASTKSGTSAKSSKSGDRSNPKSPATSKSTASRKAEPRLGALTLVSRNREVFESTAGLLYGRGSVDRHRLKHVLKHAEDNLSKPVHGVFSGDRDQILEWIDKAYIKGKKGGKGVRVNDDGDRMTYSVDMGEKVGFVGGQVGKRKGHPACRYLKLVLEDGNEVVTAYPQQYL